MNRAGDVDLGGAEVAARSGLTQGEYGVRAARGELELYVVDGCRWWSSGAGRDHGEAVEAGLVGRRAEGHDQVGYRAAAGLRVGGGRLPVCGGGFDAHS